MKQRALLDQVVQVCRVSCNDFGRNPILFKLPDLVLCQQPGRAELLLALSNLPYSRGEVVDRQLSGAQSLVETL